MADDTVYIILRATGRSISEAFCGVRLTREAAQRDATWLGASQHEVHACSREGLKKITRTVEQEREYLETLRTGLSRRARGAR